MKLLQLLFVVQFITIFLYTGYVVAQDGWILAEVFFGDIMALGWAGQFNFDFLNYLVLSALWVAWRHKFSPVGLVLALMASVLGILFFAPYLLYHSIKAGGDMRVLLLNEQG